jgi:hypothetical protein
MALDNVPLKEVAVDTAAGGDNVIVAGVLGTTITVIQLFLVLGGDTLLTFKNGVGGTEFDGPLTMFAGGSIVLDRNNPRPHWFRCGDGNSFVINLAPGVQLSGRVYYTQAAV